MRSSPRNPNESLLSGSLLTRILAISVFNLIVIFGLFQWIQQTTENTSLARTMAVNALVAGETFYLLSISQFVPAVFANKRDKNNPIGYAPAIGIICVVILQVVFTQWSLMNQLFGTVPLSFVQAVISIGAGLPIIFVALLLKRFAPMK